MAKTKTSNYNEREQENKFRLQRVLDMLQYYTDLEDCETDTICSHVEEMYFKLGEVDDHFSTRDDLEEKMKKWKRKQPK